MTIRRTTAGKSPNYKKTKDGAGMTAAGRRRYNKETGGNLKPPVTKKSNLSAEDKKRRASYCARSEGQLKQASAATRRDPNSRINVARRNWRCT
jgi:hypothetical protein